MQMHHLRHCSLVAQNADMFRHGDHETSYHEAAVKFLHYKRTLVEPRPNLLNNILC